MSRQNRQVAEAWKNGRPLKAWNGKMKTDGMTIWSYNLIIGKTIEGKKVAYQYQASVNTFVSPTTSQHVGLTMQHADTIVIPEDYE